MSWLIRWYQLVFSPIFSSLGCQCRFYPSCSAYARAAFAQYPWWMALSKSIGRVFRCNPWNPGGVDPV